MWLCGSREKNDKAVRQLELTYGGGKTHTLIALRHLLANPSELPDLPAIDEFRQAIGQEPPKARVVGLCFDKIDLETGTDVCSPSGSTRRLLQPWSVLAYQLAGDEGLMLMHGKGKAEERKMPPAENVLTDLLKIPVEEGLGVLILIDEVLMFARSAIDKDPNWNDRLANFFQYLTQAVAKVNRCCLVASLLASEPSKTDVFGRRLLGEIYDIFQRQREEVVEPVVKEDVAEVLRRRFFTPESLKERDLYRPHVQAALKGVFDLDEHTLKQGADAEDRYLRSYPFHPEITEVFYSKWTQLDRFQRTRGVLRTFALALREAEKWDDSPLIGPSVFLNGSGRDGLSEAMRELITVADTEEHEGKRQSWAAIVEGELQRARDIQKDSVGLRFREVEQAVVATFLHSQPIGQIARTRDLTVLIAPGRPDKIELEKGLLRWSQVSFWLDDQYAADNENEAPETWRLGARPNLTQMHAVAASRISDESVASRLLDSISKTKKLFGGTSESGVHVHVLPTHPRDIPDDGSFHFAILAPAGASESGKPSVMAKRFLEETTGPDKPRVYRNAVILLAPSKDGLQAASARVRDLLAWQHVAEDLKQQEKEGNLDAARLQTLNLNIRMAEGRIPEAVRGAYCTVVTVSAENQVQAFKIQITEEPHFHIIKNDQRSRIQDSAVAADALLPEGPYDLWKDGETSRRLKDLSGAFAQLPHLPKMLKAGDIVDTLALGCKTGTFVLRLTRPDASARTWWFSKPDETAMKDPALELVLPEAADLLKIDSSLLKPGGLPELWKDESITVQDVIDYFKGGNVVQIQREGYSEPLTIPKASAEVVEDAVKEAVESGYIWLLFGQASILEETIPEGILTEQSELRKPPETIGAVEILPESLPKAWKDGKTTAFAIANAISKDKELPLPWKTVRDAISDSIQARFIALDSDPQNWPCDYASAKKVKIIQRVDTGGGGWGGGGKGGKIKDPNLLVTYADLTVAEVQELGDRIQELKDITVKANIQLACEVFLKLGDGSMQPDANTIKALNHILVKIKEDLKFE